MSDATKKEVIVEYKEETMPKPKEASKTLLLSSGIGIRNAAALPGKLIAILDYYYKNIDPRSGVMSIIARTDNYPIDSVGISFPWVYSFAVNLQRVFDRTRIKLEKSDSGMDLRTAIWVSLLDVCLHETVHIAMAFADEAEYAEYLAAKDDELEAAMELTIKEIAREKLFDLAKVVDIEPPPIAEMGWIGGLIMAYFIEDQDNELVTKTQDMIEKGLVYLDQKDENSTIYHKTLRSFVRNHLVPAEVDTADWGDDDGVSLVNVSFTMQDGSVITQEAEPVETAVAETADVVLATGDAVQAHAAAAVAAAADFDPELVAGGEEEPVEEESGQDMEAVVRAFGGTAPIAQSPAVQPATTTQPVGDIPSLALPQTVVDQQTANAAATAAPVTPTAAPPLPVLNLDPQRMTNCLIEVYKTLYYTLFTSCGWHLDPQTQSYQFKDINAVKFSVDLSKIVEKYGCQGLLVEYTSVNQNDQDTTYNFEGYMSGFVFRDKALPAYQLTLNVNGQRVVRRLVPQNPNKITNNAYTKGAEQARGGNAIMYIFSMADSSRPWGERCPAKIVNNEYHAQK